MFKTPIAFRLRKLTEYFVNYELIHQSEEQYRARILSGCLLVMAFYAWLISFILLYEYITDSLEPIGLIMSVIIGCFYILCLFLLKNTGKTLIIAHAFVTPLYICLVASCFITGGSIASSNQILLLVPLIVFFTAGLRSGFIWSIIALGTLLTVFLIEMAGYEFMQAMNQQTQLEQGFFHWVIALSGIIGIAYVYERAHQNLVHQRNMRESDNRFLTDHDLLTGVANRHAFEKQIIQHIKSTHKHKLIFSLLLININDMYHINARYGYTVGDNILLTLANRFKSMKDIKIVARTHGNQFSLATFSHGKETINDSLIAEILELASQPFNIGHQIISINVTLGITQFSNGMMTSDELMLQAEESLNIAKEKGLSFSIT